MFTGSLTCPHERHLLRCRRLLLSHENPRLVGHWRYTKHFFAGEYSSSTERNMLGRMHRRPTYDDLLTRPAGAKQAEAAERLYLLDLRNSEGKVTG